MMTTSDYYEIMKEAEANDSTPTAHNRDRAVSISHTVETELRKRTMACKARVGGYVVIRHRVNFGTMRWPDWRTVIDMYRVEKITKCFVYAGGYRVPHENVICTLKEG